MRGPHPLSLLSLRERGDDAQPRERGSIYARLGRKIPLAKSVLLVPPATAIQATIDGLAAPKPETKNDAGREDENKEESSR